MHYDTFQYARKHKRKNPKHNAQEEMEMESVQAQQMGDVAKIWSQEGDKFHLTLHAVLFYYLH